MTVKKFIVIADFTDKETGQELRRGDEIFADEYREKELRIANVIGREIVGEAAPAPAVLSENMEVQGDQAKPETVQEVTTGGNVEKEEDEADADEAVDPRLVHVGGGYYELPNGERIRGKKAAAAALAVLDAGGEQ